MPIVALGVRLLVSAMIAGLIALQTLSWLEFARAGVEQVMAK